MTVAESASLYSSASLHGSGNLIRLLEILADSDGDLLSCRMRVVQLDDSLVFKALSYTWGEPIGTQTICINGIAVKVRQNLYEFLLEYRSSTETSLLWVDALCINQNDVQERNTQVQLMSRIYTRSSQTIIWLGQPHHLYGGISNGEIFDYLNSFSRSDLDDGAWVARSYKWQTGLSALAKIPHWSRLWIIQEAVLSNNIVMWCGDRRVRWCKLQNGYVVIEQAKKLTTLPSALRDTCLFRVLELKHGAQYNSKFELFELLANTHHTEAVDFIYGAVSLLPKHWMQQQGITVDYAVHPCDLFLHIISHHWPTKYNWVRFGSILLTGLKIHSADLEARCNYWALSQPSTLAVPISDFNRTWLPENGDSFIYSIVTRTRPSSFELDEISHFSLTLITRILTKFRDDLHAEYKIFLLYSIKLGIYTHIFIHYPPQNDPSGPGTLSTTGKLILSYVESLPIVRALTIMYEKMKPAIPMQVCMHVPVDLLRYVAWQWAGAWRDTAWEQDDDLIDLSSTFESMQTSRSQPLASTSLSYTCRWAERSNLKHSRRISYRHVTRCARRGRRNMIAWKIDRAPTRKL